MRDLYENAVRYIAEKGVASAGVLQRKFNLGYPDADSLISRMEHDGVISPQNSRGVREVLIAPDEVDEFLLRKEMA